MVVYSVVLFCNIYCGMLNPRSFLLCFYGNEEVQSIVMRSQFGTERYVRACCDFTGKSGANKRLVLKF